MIIWHLSCCRHHTHFARVHSCTSQRLNQSLLSRKLGMQLPFTEVPQHSCRAWPFVLQVMLSAYTSLYRSFVYCHMKHSDGSWWQLQPQPQAPFYSQTSKHQSLMWQAQSECLQTACLQASCFVWCFMPAQGMICCLNIHPHGFQNTV